MIERDEERVDGRDYVFERALRASPARVWEAWTNANQLARWFGPTGFRVLDAVFDARPSGVWRIVIEGPDGIAYPIGGTVLEVEAGSRVRMTMSTEGYPDEFYEAFAAVGGVSRPVRAEMTVTITPQGTGCILRVQHRFELPADAIANARVGTGDGLAQMLDRLELLAAVLDPDERTLVISRQVSAPREQVFAAFSTSGALDAWFGPSGFTTRTSEFAFEVGRAWIFEMVHARHGVYPNRVRWTTIAPPERIDWDHDDGEGSRTFHTTIWLECDGDGTHVHLVQTHPSAEARAQVEGFGAVELGGQTLGKLAAHVEGAASL